MIFVEVSDKKKLGKSQKCAEKSELLPFLVSWTITLRFFRKIPEFLFFLSKFISRFVEVNGIFHKKICFVSACARACVWINAEQLSCFGLIVDRLPILNIYKHETGIHFFFCTLLVAILFIYIWLNTEVSVLFIHVTMPVCVCVSFIFQ